jgi:hypothetical protein
MLLPFNVFQFDIWHKSSECDLRWYGVDHLDKTTNGLE